MADDGITDIKPGQPFPRVELDEAGMRPAAVAPLEELSPADRAVWAAMYGEDEH